MSDQPAPNRLADETSPYLLQHAHNPVDWYPWGPEALERARAEDKPILLSIGYAACHWCHVMAHESFEDAETAAQMNRDFVCVKVDREERPDLDGIYMDAVQAMTGHGGWPMTVFLTPEGGPFYAGTYYPKVDRPGMPSFRRVLAAVADAWANRRDDARRQGEQVVQVLAAQAGTLGGADGQAQLDEGILRQAFDGLRTAFDPNWGGFGPAPKFPQPMTLEFLLRCSVRGFSGALEMASLTLDRMAAGGIFDQVGGGFHRYSTDGRWLVPHFEKMLYDNAQLVRLYTHAWQRTGDDRYRRVAARTADYLLRELRHPDGGFFSSQDADSEGVEGKFFVWSWDELVAIAGEAVARHLGATPEGNWEGTNVLWTPQPAGPELQAQVDEALPRLFEAREARVHPATDDKVLAAWNGLAISALAEAGRSFGEPRYTDAALAAAGFVLDQLSEENGRLLRSWREGRQGGPGYLDDYACMAEACLTLYETTFDLRWLREARRLAAAMVELFADPGGDGFYQTGRDAEELVVRPRELFDNAVPAGSSVAADVLQRLGRLTGDPDTEQAGLSALRPVLGVLGRAPTGFGHALGAADFALARVREVAIVGRPGAADTDALLARVWGTYQPNRVLAAADPGDAAAQAEVPLLADRPVIDDSATAYVCEHFVCQRPVTEPADLAAQLA
jgi:uncharacterized protein YyaL (SSP411 family)